MSIATELSTLQDSVNTIKTACKTRHDGLPAVVKNYMESNSPQGEPTEMDFGQIAVYVENLFDGIDTMPQVLSGTDDPTAAMGRNGDIYIKLS